MAHLLRCRLPVEEYEILRRMHAYANRYRYRPLEPPPPSGHIEVAMRIPDRTWSWMQVELNHRRAQNLPCATLSGIVGDLLVVAAGEGWLGLKF